MIRRIIRIDQEKCNGCGACANACLFTEDFELKGVFARGREMMRDGAILVKGTFEY